MGLLLGASLFALGDPGVAAWAGEPETELLILIVWDRDLSVAVDPELLCYAPQQLGSFCKTLQGIYNLKLLSEARITFL
jgi:hypothetical protein